MTEPLSRQALAVVRSPDRRATWVIVLVASIDPGARPDQARLEVLHRALPLIGARVDGDRWTPGPAPTLLDVGDRDPLADVRLMAPIDLVHGAPLRVAVGAGARRVAVAGHHAAFDGRALAGLLSALLGGDLPPAPAASESRSSSPSPVRRGPAVRRLLNPADRVAPSTPRAGRESFVSRPVAIAGGGVTARLASAAAGAVGEWNARRGARWRRIGISVAVGGPPGIGNLASYRRIDTGADDDIGAAVAGALADPAEPAELVAAPRYLRLLAPLAPRFSDSFLVSNLGRVDVARAQSLEFFPVARGRSAVALGAATVTGGASTLTLRARDLDEADAGTLLDAVVTRLR